MSLVATPRSNPAPRAMNTIGRIDLRIWVEIVRLLTPFSPRLRVDVTTRPGGRTMNASEPVGTVRALWRFPVKSMLGEELAAADVSEGGVVGDRAYALKDRETGQPGLI